MRLIADAVMRFRVDTGRHPQSLAELRRDHPHDVPLTDGWGNPFRYSGEGEMILISLGADGAPGPDAPLPWRNEPFEADLMVQNGQFVQVPELR